MKLGLKVSLCLTFFFLVPYSLISFVDLWLTPQTVMLKTIAPVNFCSVSFLNEKDAHLS